jgi:hypothetical protein
MHKYTHNYDDSNTQQKQNKLTARSGTLFDKLSVAQLVLKFPAFYSTRRFITVFKTVRHFSLSSTKLIQSTPCYPMSLRSIIILSPYLRFSPSRGLFPTGFPTKITEYIFLLPLYIPLNRARRPG